MTETLPARRRGALTRRNWRCGARRLIFDFTHDSGDHEARQEGQSADGEDSRREAEEIGDQTR